MNQEMQICSRKEPRFKICEGNVLECETVVDDVDFRSGTVLDVSSKGMRILAEGEFKPDQAFSTELKTDRSHGIYCGFIRRIQPWVGGQSVVGCQLVDPIPESVLEELANAGIVNRRTEDRVDWDHPASMSWELEQGEVNVTVRDYSTGGVRVFTEAPIPEGVRLRLSLEMEEGELPLNLEARTVWREQVGSGYEAGLEFTSRESAVAVIDRLTEHVEARADERKRAIQPALVGLTAVVLLAVAVVVFLPVAKLILAP